MPLTPYEIVCGAFGFEPVAKSAPARAPMTPAQRQAANYAAARLDRWQAYMAQLSATEVNAKKAEAAKKSAKASKKLKKELQRHEAAMGDLRASRTVAVALPVMAKSIGQNVRRGAELADLVGMGRTPQQRGQIADFINARRRQMQATSADERMQAGMEATAAALKAVYRMPESVIRKP